MRTEIQWRCYALKIFVHLKIRLIKFTRFLVNGETANTVHPFFFSLPCLPFIAACSPGFLKEKLKKKQNIKESANNIRAREKILRTKNKTQCIIPRSFL